MFDYPRKTMYAFGLGDAQVSFLMALRLAGGDEMSVPQLTRSRGFIWGTNGGDYILVKRLVDNKLVQGVKKGRTSWYTLTQRGTVIANMLAEDGWRHN